MGKCGEFIDRSVSGEDKVEGFTRGWRWGGRRGGERVRGGWEVRGARGMGGEGREGDGR